MQKTPAGMARLQQSCSGPGAAGTVLLTNDCMHQTVEYTSHVAEDSGDDIHKVGWFRKPTPHSLHDARTPLCHVHHDEEHHHAGHVGVLLLHCAPRSSRGRDPAYLQPDQSVGDGTGGKRAYPNRRKNAVGNVTLRHPPVHVTPGSIAQMEEMYV